MLVAIVGAGGSRDATVWVDKQARLGSLELLMRNGNHPLLTSKEAAAALRLAYATLRDWSAHGRGPIKPVKIGARVFWRRSDVERLVAGDAE